jgi:hypothetical protein
MPDRLRHILDGSQALMERLALTPFADAAAMQRLHRPCVIREQLVQACQLRA